MIVALLIVYLMGFVVIGRVFAKASYLFGGHAEVTHVRIYEKFSQPAGELRKSVWIGIGFGCVWPLIAVLMLTNTIWHGRPIKRGPLAYIFVGKKALDKQPRSD